MRWPGRGQGLQVLFTTGYTANALVHHGRVDPGDHLIGKPFTYDELAAKVRRMLDGGLSGITRWSPSECPEMALRKHLVSLECASRPSSSGMNFAA